MTFEESEHELQCLFVDGDHIYIGKRRRHLKLPDGYRVVNGGAARNGDKIMVFTGEATFRFETVDETEIGAWYTQFWLLIRPINDRSFYERGT